LAADEREVERVRRPLCRLAPLTGALLTLSAFVASPVSSAAAATGASASPRITREAKVFVGTTQMTDQGKELFLGARPQIDDRAAFAKDCPTPDSRNAFVLGCYQPGRRRIFILRVDRPDLAATMTVTAAYEMLHAAYAELDTTARKRVDAMVDDAFRASRDERLRALADELGGLPARERSDALHSLLGTEVAQLPEDLEHYYAVFFRDRQAVVSAFWSYKTAFDALDSQLDRLAQEIDGMKAQVVALHQQYDVVGADADRLTAQLKDVKSRDVGEALIAQQNAAVDHANDLARGLLAAVAQANAKIETYNGLVLDDQQRIAPLSPITAS
jgi:hypothetical protein